MKLDETPEKTSAVTIKTKAVKKTGQNTFDANNESIISLLNPLKDINLLSNFHSFDNFNTMKAQLENLIRTQSNIIFYVLHQNFMCDETHKEFFRNMIGRFYDLPEWTWKYYQGINYIKDGDKTSMLGLVLTENKHYYLKYGDKNTAFKRYNFSRKETEGEKLDIKYFNKLALEEYWGGEYDSDDSDYSAYFTPYNKGKIKSKNITYERNYDSSFDNQYEYGRMTPDNFWIDDKSGYSTTLNYWFIATYNWVDNIYNENSFREAMKSYSVFASLGLENFDKIIDHFKKKAEKLNIEWKDYWVKKWDKEDEKLIRSLSQTFPWTKEYIMENEHLLNLDVLGLNMSVPWDMELVKFFIERGYGGRMSENISVYNKVFEQILSDEIIRKLFSCEYTPYE